MATARAPLTRVLGDRVFYGWVVVGAVFVMLAVSGGLGFYNTTVYLSRLTLEQGFSVRAASGATAVFFGVAGVANLPIAGLLARRDPRWVVTAGALLAGGATVLLGRVGELWQLYATYALFGVGFAGCGLVPGTTIVTRWFSRRRAVALSVATTGLSAGGIVLTPLSAALITRHGLAEVAPWLGVAFVLGVVPITLALVRGDPGALGLRPDGDAVIEGVPLAVAGTPFREALRSRFFLAVTGGYVLVFLAQVGGMAHLFNLVSERENAVLAATAVSVLAVASIVGRLLGGWVLNRLTLRALALICAAGQGLALFVLAAAGGPAVLLSGATLLGLTVGNLLVLHSLLLADGFGVRDFPRIYSISQLFATVGVAAGPFVVGAVHDAAGGYGLAMTLAGIASFAAAAVLATVARIPALSRLEASAAAPR